MGFYPALIFLYEIGLHIIGSNGWSTTKRFREARVYWRSSHIYHSLQLPFSPKYKEWLGFIEYRYLSALNTYNTYFHTLSMQQNELLKTVLKGTLREKLPSHLQRKKGLPFFSKWNTGLVTVFNSSGKSYQLLEMVFLYWREYSILIVA